MSAILSGYVIVIYAVEGNPADRQRASDHLAAFERSGHQFAISDLTRMECLVRVLGPGDGQRLSDFFRFFHSPNLRTLGSTAAIHGRAAAIRDSVEEPSRPSSHVSPVVVADLDALASRRLGRDNGHLSKPPIVRKNADLNQRAFSRDVGRVLAYDPFW